MKAKTLRRLMNIWPPYLGAGIKIESITDDFHQVIVSLKLRWFNRNYVGSHFGGSLYAMTDPFFMLMLIKILGDRYLIWDSASEIQFIRPGRSKVTAFFALDQQQIDNVIEAASSGEKTLPVFEVSILDDQDNVIAKVKKVVYVRLKKRFRPKKT